MEANQINEAPATVSETATGKNKMSKGQMIGMVILTIVALAGVAFGVFGMMEKDKAEKNLAIKITETSGTVTEMITDKITSVDKDGTVTEITDTNVSVEPELNGDIALGLLKEYYEDEINIDGVERMVEFANVSAVSKDKDDLSYVVRYAIYNDRLGLTSLLAIFSKDDADNWKIQLAGSAIVDFEEKWEYLK